MPCIGRLLLLLLEDHARIQPPLGSPIGATKEHVTAPALLYSAWQFAPRRRPRRFDTLGYFIVPNFPTHNIEGSTVN